MWLQLLADNWRLIAAFIGGVLYLLTHRGLAMSQARKTAMTLMLAAEKRAEQLILVTGQDKFDWVIDKGYDLMPAALRMFIGKPAFRSIVQDLFDGTVRMAKQYVEDRPAPQAGTDGNGVAASAGRGKAWTYAVPNPAMPVVPPIPPRPALSNPDRTDNAAAPAAPLEADESEVAAEDGAPVQR